MQCRQDSLYRDFRLAFICHPWSKKVTSTLLSNFLKGDDYSAKLPKSINGSSTV